MTNPMQGRRPAAGRGLAATVLRAACGSHDDDRAALACGRRPATA